MDDLAKTLDTIAKFAAQQKARLQTVTIGEVSFTLVQDMSGMTAPAVKNEPMLAPMNDPKTYGLPEGATLPGFVDPRKAQT